MAQPYRFSFNTISEHRWVVATCIRARERLLTMPVIAPRFRILASQADSLELPRQCLLFADVPMDYRLTGHQASCMSVP